MEPAGAVEQRHQGCIALGTFRIPYRADIDGLRAVAVLSVVLCHAGLGLPGGYIGVDIFFVISGYLITSLIIKDLRQGTFSLTAFWERRIRRILPALLVVTVCTVVAGWFLLMPTDYESLGESVAALAFLIANVKFWRAVGYFSPSSEQVALLHTWSLAVEEQFYLFVPAFLFLLSRRKALNLALPLLALAGITSLGLSIYGTEHFVDATFYLLPTRAWELFAGALLAFLPANSFAPSSAVRELVAGLGLSLLLAPCILYNSDTPFPGLAALPPVLGTAALIWSGTNLEGTPAVNRCLGWRPLVFVGLISYSLYLWHWPILALYRAQSLNPPTLVVRILAVGASLLIATASWRWIEVPFRSGRIIPSRHQLFGVSLLVFAVLTTAGLALSLSGGAPGRLPALAHLFLTTRRRDLRLSRNVEERDIPHNLVRLGSSRPPDRVLVWGDSHAKSILPAIDLLGREKNVAVRAATHASTAPVLGYYAARTRFGLNEDSIPFNAAVIEYVRSKRGQAYSVLLAARWDSYARDAAFSGALLRTVDELRAAGAEVYFMKDVPRYNCNVPQLLAVSCMRGQNLDRIALSQRDYEADSYNYSSLLPALRGRGVVVLDPIPVLQLKSNSASLLPFDSGGSFYSDAEHLSIHGALAIKSLFYPLFQRRQVAEFH